ncbi:hypothetical protein CR513_40252, partial [Mucuna pruriens]
MSLADRDRTQSILGYEELQQLEELCLEAYVNLSIYKQKFKIGQKVLLFHSHLKLIVGKLCSRWDRPFVITNVFPYGVVEVRDEANNKTFQVNRHQLKHFYESLTPIVEEVDNISLLEPTTLDDTSSQIFLNPFTLFWKTMKNLNLKDRRSFGIVLGIGLE